MANEIAGQEVVRQIRMIEGGKISSREDVAEHNKGILLGTATNAIAYANNSVLYSEGEIFPKNEKDPKVNLHVDIRWMTYVNLFVGGQGSGKTHLTNIIINNMPTHHMIINDPKCDYIKWAYDPNQDLVVGWPDSRAGIWDFIGEIIANPQYSKMIWNNMLLVVNSSKEGAQWNTHALKPLNKLIYKIKNSPVGMKRSDAIVKAYMELEAEYGQQKTGMSSDALGTAYPIISMAYQMYWIAENDKRKLFLVEDIYKLKIRRVFLLNNPMFSEVLKIHNNALFALLANKMLSREDIKEGDTDNYWALIIDEARTFKFEPEIKEAILSKGRESRIVVVMGYTSLPIEPEELKDLTNSRHLTCIFKAGDCHTKKTVSELTEDIIYHRQEVNETYSSSTGVVAQMTEVVKGVNITKSETWIEHKTKEITTGVLDNLPIYSCFCEIQDKGSGLGQIRTFLKPDKWCPDMTVNKKYEYSEKARTAPNMEEAIEEILEILKETELQKEKENKTC